MIIALISLAAIIVAVFTGAAIYAMFHRPDSTVVNNDAFFNHFGGDDG